MCHLRIYRRRCAFTLIELLVVIAIIGILIALLLPAIQKVREAANKAKCQNNLMQLALACLNFEGVYAAYPRGNALNSSSFSNGDNRASWVFMTLPYIEQGNLYKQARDADTLTNAVNRGILPQPLPYSRCPSDGWDLRNANLFNYVGSSGPQCNNTPSGNCDTPIFQRFAECVRDRKRPLTDGESGLRVVRILEAAQRSIKAQGGRITL
jgi:prepilin-type N-terminal cleavage/methylation domain-containing protein